jgi:uncharacterized protein YifE (UPF0438 family)
VSKTFDQQEKGTARPGKTNYGDPRALENPKRKTKGGRPRVEPNAPPDSPISATEPAPSNIPSPSTQPIQRRTQMRGETLIEFNDEEQRAIDQWLWFYRALDREERPPTTAAQNRFVKCIRGYENPVTVHERAYLKWCVRGKKRPRSRRGGVPAPEILEAVRNRSRDE